MGIPSFCRLLLSPNPIQISTTNLESPMPTTLHHEPVLASLAELRTTVEKTSPINELHTICLAEVIHAINRSIQFVEDLEHYTDNPSDPSD